MVLDAGGVYGDWNLSQAQMADEILLITTNELTSLQAVQRALTYLDNNGVGRWKVRLIVNRYDRHVGLSKDVIGTALPCRHLPPDARRLRRHPEGPHGGKAAGVQNTNFGKSVIGLVDRLGGSFEMPKKGTSLSGLSSLFSRTSS